MAGDPQPESYSVEPRLIRLSNDHLKALSTLTLLLADSVVLVIAFVSGYEARMVLPFFPRPEEQPVLASYFAHHRRAHRHHRRHVLLLAALSFEARLSAASSSSAR